MVSNLPKILLVWGVLLPLYMVWGGIQDNKPSMKMISPTPFSIHHEEFASVVVSFESPDVEGIIITAEANQSITILRQEGRNTYCKTIRLLPGENKISVIETGINKKETALSSVVYHDVITDKIYKYPPETYAVKNFHIQENEKTCIPCHKMEVNEIPKVAFENPSDSNCFQCHEKLTTRGMGHAPAINWLCTSCHKISDPIQNEKDSTQQHSRFELPKKIGDECLECHKKEREIWEEKRFHHMPVDAAQCVRCHNPHSSPIKFHLKAKPWDICTSCHIDKREGDHFISSFGQKSHPTKGKPDPSRPGKELECISCHNPHASDTKSLVEGKSPMSICLKCHKK